MQWQCATDANGSGAWVTFASVQSDVFESPARDVITTVASMVAGLYKANLYRGFRCPDDTISTLLSRGNHEVSVSVSEPSTYDVFLSHGSPDKPWVRNLYAALTAAGVTAYLDEVAIEAGDNFVCNLSSGIGHTSTFVIVVSQGTMDRAWVEQEWTSFVAAHGPKMFTPPCFIATQPKVRAGVRGTQFGPSASAVSIVMTLLPTAFVVGD